MKTEPAVTIGSITAGVTAALALLVSFGLSISADQQTAILGVVAVLAPLLVGALIRPKVSPVVAPSRGFVGD